MADSSIPIEVIEEARRLWNQGKTSVQIGQIMGRTKNSIVSMAHRYDFVGRPSPIKRTAEASKATAILLAQQNPSMTSSEIAKQVGLSREVVRGLRASLPARAVAKPAKPAAAPRARKVDQTPARDGPAPAPGAGVASKTAIPSAPAPRAPPPAVASTPPPVPLDPPPPILRRLAPRPAPERRCQWPMGDVKAPDFRFCGERQDGGRWPYCAQHHRLAVARTRDEAA